MHNVASLQRFPPNYHSVQVTIWPNCLSHANHWQSLPNDWLNTFPIILTQKLIIREGNLQIKFPDFHNTSSD